MEINIRKIMLSVPWNLALLTVTGLLFSFSINSIAVYHEFVSSGLYGTALLLSYANENLNMAGMYVLFNIPCLILGWRMLSKRFVLYTLYCIFVTSAATEFIPWPDAGINDPMLAAVATGIGCGFAAGIALKTLGSDGGITILSLVLHRKYSISVGSISIIYNACLYALSLLVLDVDKVLYSMIITFITASLMNFFMMAFDQRKLVLIISEKHDQIAENIMKLIKRGCTQIHAHGAYTKQQRDILLVIVHNIELKRLEELIYEVDENAFCIIEDTQMVLGNGFSQRKKY